MTHEVDPSAVDRCVEFYGLLGFRQVQPPPGVAGRAVWLQLGPTQVHLMLKADPQHHTGHVGVLVDDYDATLNRLDRAGHQVEPRRPHWGSPRAYVRDPAGHVVELMAWAPDATAP